MHLEYLGSELSRGASLILLYAYLQHHFAESIVSLRSVHFILVIYLMNCDEVLRQCMSSRGTKKSQLIRAR